MVGSFLNVVIYRLPLMMFREWKESYADFEENLPPQLPEGKFNLAVPRSKCPHCGHLIKGYQNIPIVSYLLLKGSCANCGAKISLRYPIVEAFTGLMSALVIIEFGASTQTLAALVFVWCLISLTMIDFDHQLLPDQITLPLLWLGLLCNYFNLFTSLESAFLGAIFGYLSLWTVYWAFKLLTGKEGMGYGDFKLLAALGAWLGWQYLPLVILLSSLVGVCVGVAGMLFSHLKRDTRIAFGPYIALAGCIAFLLNDQAMKYYYLLLGGA